MTTRLLAIAFIFVCTSIAWGVLGGTILDRTNSSDERLRNRVQSIWGVPQTQRVPQAEYFVAASNGPVMEKRTISPSASDILVNLNLEYRRKGLLWYSTYRVGFRGDYEFTNPDPEARMVYLSLYLPAARATYDDLQFTVDGRADQPVIGTDRAYIIAQILPQQTIKLHVAYRSQGLDSWDYSFGEKVNPVQNFHLRMTTDFKDIDFPDNTLSPGEKREVAGGWQLDWTYKNLLSGYRIAMTMPSRLQPGPLASDISFFAPVSLFFFFFVVFILTTMRDIELHPMNYFFLAAAFFAFHLLLAYLVDHLDLYLSFTIASVVSVLLVTTYLRIVVGTQFAVREAAIAQLTYLVLFSFAFFFRGYTGLSITIGAILTLFLAMQLTGKIRWTEKFSPGASRAVPPPLPLTNP